jgi:thimet oligopeptidase
MNFVRVLRLSHRFLIAAAGCALMASFPAVQGQELPVSQPSIWATKPDVTAFEKMENDRLAAAQKAVDQIVGAKGSRTIENTLAPFDEATRQLNATIEFSGFMQQVHPDATFRDRATAMTTKASAASTALSLNRNVYQALAALDVSKSDPATRYYVERQLLEFRLAGVDKDDATRAHLRELNDKLTDQQSSFDRNISDDPRSITVDSAKDLEGLPQDYIDSHKPGADGKIRITTDYPDALPVFTFAKNESVRQRLWVAFGNRAYPKNRDVLLEMMRTRQEIATILGYSSWADYNAADKMIRNGQNIANFIRQVHEAAQPLAQREFAMLLAEKNKTSPGAKEIMDYENFYLRELVQRSGFNFDSTSVRPYFAYDHVKQGILDTAQKLFGLTFTQEVGAPAWAPDVETWDVFENGKMIGRFYLDMHPRPNKFSHAQMSPLLEGIRGKQLPEGALVCNFAAPTATDPGLMDYGDVVTFFHEFGHLMHQILSGKQQWAGVSGISMESDFAEAPSQMLEEWMRSPQVLATFAHHYKTGEAIPAELVARMNRASAFGRASWVSGQDSFSAISYEIYSRKPQDVDLDAVTDGATRQYTLLTPLAGTHMFASFGHLGGYSSAYYTYLWDKVIAEDFVTQFDPSNLLAPGPAARYRHIVLEPGGSQSANDLVKNFLGRAQNTAAFQKWMGEEFEGKQSGN